LLGEQNVFQMEHRFLNGFMLFGVLIALFSIATNTVFELPSILVLLSAIAFVFMSFFYVLSRILKIYKATLYTASIFILVFLSFFWIENAGSFGPTIYLYFVLLVFLGMFFRGIMGWIVILVYTMTITGLYVMEELLPGFVTPYSSEAVRITDHLTILLPAVAMIAFVLNMSREYYQREREKAETSSKLKSSFLANISHEIRTPMNSIIGFSQLLAENPNRDDQQRYLKLIQESGDSLLRLIDEILDISQIESGQGRISIETFNLEELLEDLFDTFVSVQNQKDKQNIKLDLKIPKDKPVGMISSDPLRIKQVFSNLLDNAMKFTEKGTIEFGYQEITSDRIHFYVKDTGIGIDPEHHEAIFNRFHKVEDRYEKIYRGTGLGLSVCKQIVELLDGHIRVRSGLGKGTEFIFDLPLLEEREPITAEMQESRQYHWTGKKILIAEHQDLNYHLLSDVLMTTSVQIIRALNGELVKAIVDDQDDFDLIILDLNLPGNEDVRLLEFIRMNMPAIPIIVFTTLAAKDEMKRCKDLGVRDVITKPIQKEQVLKMLNKHIKKRKHSK